jgi:hypothetical protein
VACREPTANDSSSDESRSAQHNSGEPSVVQLSSCKQGESAEGDACSQAQYVLAQEHARDLRAARPENSARRGFLLEQRRAVQNAASNRDSTGDE